MRIALLGVAMLPSSPRLVALVAGVLSLLACYACTSTAADESASSDSALDQDPDSATCAGLPRLGDVKTPRGVCVGVATTGIPMARGIAQLDDNRYLVTAWASDPDGSGEGAIWMLRREGQGFVQQRLTTNWKRPHGVVVTETGAVYIAEPSGITRFYPEDPDRKDAPIIGSLPDDGAHWATTLAYDSGFLYVNKGSASDNCATRDESGVHFAYPCVETEQRAQIRRYPLANPSSHVTIGRGLRNSVAMTVHPLSHVLLQGENGQNDLNMEDPKEELNVIGAPPGFDPGNVPQVEGRHYGWPYCYADERVTPGFAGRAGTLAGAGTPFDNRWCQIRTAAPALLLPPHSAPLGMAYLKGAMFPFRGQLVVGYHGFAKTGHKLVVVDVDANGVPTGRSPRDLVYGWGGDPSRGKPMGKPVSVIEARDGALMVTDDRNGMVLRVVCDKTRGACQPEGEAVDVMPVDPDKPRRCAELDARLGGASNAMAQLQRDVIDPNCVSCHGNPLAQPGGVVLRACDDKGTADWLRSSGWVTPGNPAQSRLIGIVELGMGGLSATQLGQLRSWIAAGAPPP